MNKNKKLKIIIMISLILIILFILTGCGNKTTFDTTYTFNYAQFKNPDNTIIEGRVLKWNDYDGEQIQLTMEDGNVYIVNSKNLTMATNPIVKEK